SRLWPELICRREAERAAPVTILTHPRRYPRLIARSTRPLGRLQKMMRRDSPVCSTADEWEPPRSSGASPASSAEAGPLKLAGRASGRQVKRQRLQSLHGYVARTVVVTVAASAAVLDTMPEGPPDSARGPSAAPLPGGSFLLDLAAKVPALLRSALQGAGACAREAFGGLSAALGEPPRRPFEDPSAPGGLPWVADVAMVCCILAVVMFVLAFATMPRGCEVGEDPDAVHEEDPAEQTGFARIRARLFRVIVVAIMPAAAGATLNAKRALIPALLCSF
ncbi:unnamed protein product, partial [Prorocentrum cordatum]